MSGPQKANDLLGQIPKTKGLPPVHLWNPDFCGDIERLRLDTGAHVNLRISAAGHRWKESDLIAIGDTAATCASSSDSC